MPRTTISSLDMIGRPLGEARLIFEVGAKGVDVDGLRRELRLDAEYLSRLLRSLEAQGLILVHEQVGDGLVRRVSLTSKGHAEFATHNGFSDKLAESILTPLDAAGVQVTLEAPTNDDARWCLAEYFRELAERFEAGFDPTKSNPAREEEMTPPAGVFVVARLDDHPVGCGALKRKDQTTGEIKRMWTASSARRRGVARKVLQTLETAAREFGLTMLRLETNRALTEAQALYRKAGYREVGPFNDEPYAHHWFEKNL